MLDHMEYTTYSSEAADAETYSSTTTPPSQSSSMMMMMMMMRKNSTSKKKMKMNNNNNNNTRRFSDEQIKSLESMFETETRLEPRKKLQLARELGLQPRQVAIWFQNKRARWKSKQLETDYTLLMNNFNNLNSKFEALKKEKQALLIQLQKLNDLIQKPLEQAQSSTQVAKPSNSNNMDSESSENCDTTTTTKSEPDLNPRTSSSMQRSTEHHHNVLGSLSDDDTSIKVEYFGNIEDEHGLLNFAEHGDAGSLTSPEDWGTFESDGILGQSTSDYQWWDFWS